MTGSNLHTLIECPQCHKRFLPDSGFVGLRMPAGLKVWELHCPCGVVSQFERGHLWIYDAARDEYYSEEEVQFVG